MDGSSVTDSLPPPDSQQDNRRTGAADAILDAAETLFGRHGTEGVSLRQIAVAAGSANHSAVQYYFSNKEGLMRGIFERRLQSLEQARSLRLAQARDAGRGADVRSLLAALLLPIAEERDSEGRCSFAAFLLGMRLFGDISQWSLYAQSAQVTREIDGALRTALGAAGTEAFQPRILSAVSLFLIAVTDWDRGIAGGDDRSTAARASYLDAVIDFAAAGLQAAYPGN